MIIHKFGGASIQNPDALQQMVSICKSQVRSGVIVVSAMGKMTNLLEKITLNYFKKQSVVQLVDEFKAFHQQFLVQLFEPNHTIFTDVDHLLDELKSKLAKKPGLNFDFEYDQIVPFGELISSRIVCAYQNTQGIAAEWLDSRNFLKTDNTYREANVNWELTGQLMKETFSGDSSITYLTQGFIGSDVNGLMTTLGREGSDYTAAIIANCLNAKLVIVWKDVPGILCADPDWIPNAQKIDKLNYSDAIELSYYGAKVIHPKTIKPLQNKSIPLQVRSFYDLGNEGTSIGNFGKLNIPPVYIKKEAQVLISIRPFDLSFILEENLSHIFGLLAKHQIKVNLMQNSAISFSITVDTNMDRVTKAIKELKQYYDVKYNEPLELITIRHNQPNAEDEVIKNREVLLEQRSRSVARFVVR
jgi:aspartate kinase